MDHGMPAAEANVAFDGPSSPELARPGRDSVDMAEVLDRELDDLDSFYSEPLPQELEALK
jgi:hypothetical protein